MVVGLRVSKSPRIKSGAHFSFLARSAAPSKARQNLFLLSRANCFLGRGEPSAIIRAFLMHRSISEATRMPKSVFAKTGNLLRETVSIDLALEDEKGLVTFGQANYFPLTRLGGACQT